MAHFLVLEHVVGTDFLTESELVILLEPTVERLGYELADVEARLGGKGGLVRVTIDKPDGIDLDDCEKVSLAVSALLDVEDPVPGNYNLEVSSPGLDRKLTKVAHFQRFQGETVKVQMRFPIEGRSDDSGARWCRRMTRILWLRWMESRTACRWRRSIRLGWFPLLISGFLEFYGNEQRDPDGCRCSL